MRTLTTVLVLLTVGIVMVGPSADEPPPSGWAAMARDDLQFVHDTIDRHHPGPHDALNEVFAEWQVRGLEEGLRSLGKVKSYGGYRAVLQRYIAGFRDGHLTLNLSLDYRVVGWPGIVLSWRDGAIVVHHANGGEGSPAVGARLVSCDGVDAETLFRERVLAYHGKAIPADRARFVPELFIDRVNPLLPDLEQCRFEHGGTTSEAALEWTWQPPDELRPLLRLARFGERGGFEMRDLGGDGVWVSLPTFGPRGAELEQMKSLMAALPDQRDRAFVVVDVRHNSGGSSYWAEAFVRGLYGDAFWEARPDPEAESFAVHRVSGGNLKHFRDLLPRIERESGADGEFYRYFAALVDGMTQSLEAGQELFEHRYESEDKEGPSRGEAIPLYRGRVYFLTDSNCASACLDFADTVLDLPGVVHVGQPTNADTLYMEVRSVRLPSNNGRLTFATKVWRGRERGHNVDYTPRHLWHGDPWDTDALESWILELTRSAQARQGTF